MALDQLYFVTASMPAAVALLTTSTRGGQRSWQVSHAVHSPPDRAVLAFSLSGSSHHQVRLSWLTCGPVTDQHCSCPAGIEEIQQVLLLLYITLVRAKCLSGELCRYRLAQGWRKIAELCRDSRV